MDNSVSTAIYCQGAISPPSEPAKRIHWGPGEITRKNPINGEKDDGEKRRY